VDPIRAVIPLAVSGSGPRRQLACQDDAIRDSRLRYKKATKRGYALHRNGDDKSPEHGYAHNHSLLGQQITTLMRMSRYGERL